VFITPICFPVGLRPSCPAGSTTARWIPEQHLKNAWKALKAPEPIQTTPPSGRPKCTPKRSHALNARVHLSLLATLLAVAFLFAPSAPAEPLPGAEAAIAKAESALGTDQFGPWGCEAFVAWAYGVPQGQYGWDGAAETMYQTLLRQGQIHTGMNAPRGALVFSKSPYGAHIDIARGDGTYISGGVQGLTRGYGDGHNIQILPSPHVGSGWTYRGWSLGFPQ
jgi:hypothetical protein